MEITRITIQKKRKNRYNIFIDEGHGEQYGFSVDEDILIKYHLRKGLQLDEVTKNSLIEQDSIHKTYSEVINYLSYRMRTKDEIRTYLIKKEVDSEHITQVLQRLINENLVDDVEFAHMFVRNRINMSTKGPSLVKKELMQKGISNEIATVAVSAYTYEIQYEKAEQIMKKRMQRSSNHSHCKQLDQLRANLMRNGFSHEVINDVISEVEAQDEEKEWGALTHHGERLLRRHAANFEGYELQNKVKEGLYRQGFSFSLIQKFLDERLEQ